MNQPLRAAIYARISQNREGDENKTRRQIDRCTALAEVRSYEVVGVYEDDDISAYRGAKERPAYDRLLSDIAQGDVDVVVAFATDRLLRTVRDMVDFIEVAQTRSEADGQ